MSQKRAQALWDPSAFRLPSWASIREEKQSSSKAEATFKRWAVLRSKVTRVSLVPSGRDLYRAISEPAALGSKAELHPKPDHALTWFWTVLCHHVIPQHPKEGSASACRSVYLSAALPGQEAVSHHRPARSSPVSCSILPGLPCFFLLPSPCPTAVRPCLHFCLLPSFLSLPVPPRARCCSILPERLRPEPKLARVR